MSRTPRTTPRNLRRGVGRISGGIVEKLNAIGRASGLEGHENLGSELAREINQHLAKISIRQDAQAGFGGTVVVAPQPRQPGASPPPLGMALSGGRLGDIAPAVQGTDVPNLDQVRSMFTCESFGGHVSGFAGWMEDCVDQRRVGATTPVATPGVMPYFFGWTVHVPPEADTIVIDPFSSSNLDLWSFVLPAPATVARISYRLFQVISTFTPDHFINIGLYDADKALVFETGPIDIQDPGNPTMTLDGTFTFELEATFDLLPGEYFLALSAGACIRMSGIATSVDAISMLDHAEVQDQGLLTPGPYGDRMFEFNPTGGPAYLGFPATLETSTGFFLSFYEDHLDAPMILFEGVRATYNSP